MRAVQAIAPTILYKCLCLIALSASCRSSAYLTVGRNKFWRKNHVKAHYAFNEQVAMVDFTYNENKSNDKPLAKVRHSKLVAAGFPVTSCNSFDMCLCLAGIHQGSCWSERLWSFECGLHYGQDHRCLDCIQIFCLQFCCMGLRVTSIGT